MLRHHFLITIRHLMRNKTFSFINIFGLSFGLACCIMIFHFISFEYSYNTFLPNHEDIYQVMNDSVRGAGTNSDIDHRYAKYLPETFSQIQAATAFLIHSNDIQYKNIKVIGKMMKTDSSFFDVFPFPFIDGNPTNSFGSGKIILSKKIANELFGAINPIGEILIINQDEEYIVSGIIENIPANSSIKFDMLIPGSKQSGNNVCYGDDCMYMKTVFARLHPNTESIQLNPGGKAEQIFSSNFQIYFGLQALDDLYFHDKYKVYGLEKGNINLIRIFLGIALIVLLLAILNYVNLSLSRIVSRYKEIGLKKTIGASRQKLVFQILFESVFITGLAFLLALLIAELASPFLLALLGKQIPAISYLSFPSILILTAAPIVVGIIAGLYPSFIFSSYAPKRILSGTHVNKTGKNPFMYYLTVFQFSIAIIMISCTLVMYLQIDFVKHKDLGFNETQLLQVAMASQVRDKHEVFRNALISNPEVLEITASGSVPGRIRRSVLNDETDNKNVYIIEIDADFLKVFEIKLLEGRTLLNGDINKVAYVNETARKVLDWDSIEGKTLLKKEIIGVVNDFHTGSMYKSIEPVMLVYDNTDNLSFLTLRIKGNRISQTIDFISAEWKKICPDFPMQYEFYDDYFNSMYEKEERLSKLMSVFSLLAIIISCLGIIGMVEFTTINKTKEIGIRKTLGARTSDIIRILSKSYLVIFSIAIVVAIPIAWKISDLWLHSFAYKMELSGYHFVLAGGVIAFISLITISFQTIKTALKNPVEALRNE